MTKYILYTSTKCPNCKSMKKHLAQALISYEERNISDPENRKQLLELGAMGVPTLLNPSNSRFVVGYNKTKVDDLLSQTK